MEPQIMHRGNKSCLTEQWYQAASSAPLLSGECCSKSSCLEDNLFRAKCPEYLSLEDKQT